LKAARGVPEKRKILTRQRKEPAVKGGGRGKRKNMIPNPFKKEKGQEKIGGSKRNCERELTTLQKNEWQRKKSLTIKGSSSEGVRENRRG